MDNRSDFEIISDVLKGSVNSFETLVLRYEKMIYSLCYTKIKNRETALDLTQECFLKTFKTLASFKNTSAFSTWIYSICKNLIIDYLRKNKHESLSTPLTYYDGEGEEKNIEISDSSPTPEDEYIRRERSEIVREAIRSLPPALSEVIILRDIQDLNYQQISEALEIDIGTVKSRIFRGREKLREILKERLELF